jgi:hypothetical protein
MLQTKFPGRQRSEFPRRKVTRIARIHPPAPRDRGIGTGEWFTRNFPCPHSLVRPSRVRPRSCQQSVSIRGQNQDSRRSNGSAHRSSSSTPFAPIRGHSFPFALKKSRPRMARIHTDPSSRRRQPNLPTGSVSPSSASSVGPDPTAPEHHFRDATKLVRPSAH